MRNCSIGEVDGYRCRSVGIGPDRVVAARIGELQRLERVVEAGAETVVALAPLA